jgi:hypothetical protein
VTAITRTYVHSAMRVETRSSSSSNAFDAKALQITFDKSWSPYGQATLTCGALPLATVAAMEPRNGMRLRWRTTQTNSDGKSFYQDFDLGLRSRVQSWSTNELVLTGATDEALLQDYGYLSAQAYQGSPVNPGSGTYWASVLANYAVSGALPAGFTTTPGVSPELLVDAVDAVSDVGTSAWDWASAMAEAAGAWLWVDETAVPRWTVADYSPAGFTLYLDDYNDILDVSDTVSRDDPAFGNAVVIAYTGNSPTAYLTSSAGIDPRKTITIQRARRRPSNGSATKPRQQATLHGRSLVVKAAADIRTRPNQSASISWLGQSATGTVQRVAFDFPAATMDVTVNI